MKYSFARFYLAIMLILAVFTLIVGIVIGGYYWLSSASAYLQIPRTNSRPYTLDTSTVARELHATQQSLFYGLKNTKFTDIPMPSENNFPISETATLSPYELERYARFLQEACTTRDAFKKLAVATIQDSVTALINASQDALPRNTSSPRIRQSPTPPSSGNAAAYYLYEETALTVESIQLLKGASHFLANQIGYYTPSVEAQKLASAANLNLQAIAGLMEKERNAYRHSSFSESPAPAAEALAPRSPSKQEALISEFISYLNQVKDLVSEKALKGWRLDNALRETQEACRQAQAERSQEIRSLKDRASSAFLLGALALFISVLISVLLLIVRDFMSAVIDTAANTGEMVKRLSLLTVDDPR